MPQIIREALQDRIWESPPVQDFEKSFRTVTGMPLRFLSAEGTVRESVELGATAPVCAWMHAEPSRCTICSQMRRSLLQRAEQGGIATGICQAGLTESVVALKTGQQVLGFFQTGFVRVADKDLPARKLPSGLQQQATSPKLKIRLRRLYDATAHMTPEQYDAMVRLLHHSAEHIASRANQILVHELPKLPPAVQQACDYIKEHFREPLSLAALGKVVHLSPLHLCKTFHKHTGMRFKEYLARVRISRCKDELAHTDHKMAVIAFASGFESLSQFNRRFQSLVGMTPREFRRLRTAALPADESQVPGNQQ